MKGLLALLLLSSQDPQIIRNGPIGVVFWPQQQRLATALAEQVAGWTTFRGLRRAFADSVTVFLAPDQRLFDSLTSGRLPDWGAGAAFLDRNAIVLLGDGDPFRIAHHEMAHLALHGAAGRLPTWFAEGYAVWATGEWDRLEALRVNLALVVGRVPTLAGLNRMLRGGSSGAGAGYALAATTVVTLARIGGDAGFESLMAELAANGGDLDAALRNVYLITLGQFEGLWRRELKNRYGWLSFVTSFTVFWVLMGGFVAYVWARRRRRDEARKARLDEGWLVVEAEQDDSS